MAEVVPQAQPEAVTLDAVRALMAETAKKMEETATAAVRGAVVEFRKDDTARLKELHDAGVLGGVPALSGARIVDPRQHLYERMKRLDPEMAFWRSPDSDHWLSQYIRAMGLPGEFGAEGARAIDELKKLYVRATLAEGTPSNTTSGLSPGTAGAIIPLPLASMIMVALNRSAKIRNLAEVFQSTAKTLRVPTSGVATAYMVAEGATATQGEPTLTGKMLDKEKMQCQFAVSKETLRDSAFDLVSFFSERAGSAMGQLEDVEICTAASTPTVTNAIITGVTDIAQATPGTLIYQDLVDFWFQLPEPYQQSATWLVASNIAAFMSRMVITGGMGPVLVPKTGPFVTVGDLANVQGTIFGRPVIVVPLAAGSCVLGDIRRGYGILDEPGIEAEASAVAGWTTDSVFYKFTRRLDGNVMVADAMRKFDAVTAIA